MSSLHDRARKLARELCMHYSVHVHVEPAIANAMVALARDFAAEALREVVTVKYGEWWAHEGNTYRIVARVTESGPASKPFRTEKEAEQRRDKIITAAISRAEEGEGR